MRSSDMEQLPGVEQALTVINKTHLQTIFCLSAATNRSHLDSDRRGRGGHRWGDCVYNIFCLVFLGAVAEESMYPVA